LNNELAEKVLNDKEGWEEIDLEDAEEFDVVKSEDSKT